MADFEITSPDGKTFVVSAPEGATQEQVLAYAQGQFSQPEAPKSPSIMDRAGRVAGLGARSLIRGATALPTLMAEGVAAPLRALSGGKYFESPSAVLERKMTEAGLPEPANAAERISTNIAGAMAGGGTTIGAAALSQPTSIAGQGIRELLLKQPATQLAAAGTGAASSSVAGELGAGPVGQAVAGVAGSMVPFVPGMFRGPTTPEAKQRMEVLSKGREEGLVFPPSQINPSATNKFLGGYAGQAATDQAASLKNQVGVNAMARRAIGVAEDAPLNVQTLERVRNEAAAPYREIAAISPSAKDYLQKLREARLEANEQYKYFNRSGQPEARKAAEAASNTASQIEGLLERFANSLNRPGLVDELRKSRELIAKTHEVERALNATTGDIDSRLLGGALDRGAPLSGPLRTIAQVQQASPRSMIPDINTRTPPGVSPLDYAAGGLMGAASGNYGMMGTILGRPIARSLILNPWYQSLMATPNLSPLARPDAAALGLLNSAYQ